MVAGTLRGPQPVLGGLKRIRIVVTGESPSPSEIWEELPLVCEIRPN
jgi:hypothetical protein